MIKAHLLNKVINKDFNKEFDNLYQARLFLNKVRYSKKIKLLSVYSDKIEEMQELRYYESN